MMEMDDKQNLMNILITRPQRQAVDTAAQIEKRGLRTFILPLAEIRGLDFSSPRGNFEALLATSANSFTLLAERPSKTKASVENFRCLPLFCVGEQTALAAQKAGFINIAAIAEEVGGLASLLKSQPFQHFLYLAGKIRRPILERDLRAQGKIITILEIYQQYPLMPTHSHIAALPTHFDYALFYSAMAAQTARYVETCFDRDTQFLCLSQRIAHALPQKFQPQARIATAPNETRLLELIQLSNHL